MRAEGGLLLAILAGAALLRCCDLASLPPAHYRDVALTATDALRAAAGHPRLHFTYDEGLYADLMGGLFRLIGPSDVAVRLPGAIFGLLTCWGVYLLGAALGDARAGVWGAGLLAVSLWHLILSRSGFRAVLLPLLLVVSMALLVEALRRGGRVRFAAAGALFGLGVHVYPAVRFAPFILLPLWLAERRRDAPRLRRARGGLALFVGAAFLVALPMLVHYVRNPQDFNFPHRVVSVFSSKFSAARIPAVLAGNLLRTALMFHVRGDDNWRHNIAGAPLLDPLTGILVLAGAVLLLRRRRRVEAALLFGWIGVMLLPNLLSVEGVPHALRSCGTLPALALLGGVGLAAAEEQLARRVGGRKAAAVAAIILTLLGCWTAYRYFRVWGDDPRVAEAHDGAYRAAARRLLQAPPGVGRYLVANGTGLPVYGHPVEIQAYLFEMRAAPPILLGPKDAGRLVLQGRPALVALVRDDPKIIEIIRRLNPGAPVRRLQGPGLSPDSPVYRIN
jgi:4-amino-4-deoxy-L-arabinose transferase-like glycosyltransferase